MGVICRDEGVFRRETFRIAADWFEGGVLFSEPRRLICRVYRMQCMQPIHMLFRSFDHPRNSNEAVRKASSRSCLPGRQMCFESDLFRVAHVDDSRLANICRGANLEQSTIHWRVSIFYSIQYRDETD